MIRSACVDELALDQPADDAAGAQRMVLGDHALAFRGRQHRRAEPLGELHELGATRLPQNTPRPAIRIGRLRAAQHVERRLQVGAVRAAD